MIRTVQPVRPRKQLTSTVQGRVDDCRGPRRGFQLVGRGATRSRAASARSRASRTTSIRAANAWYGAWLGVRSRVCICALLSAYQQYADRTGRRGDNRRHLRAARYCLCWGERTGRSIPMVPKLAGEVETGPVRGTPPVRRHARRGAEPQKELKRPMHNRLRRIRCADE